MLNSFSKELKKDFSFVKNYDFSYLYDDCSGYGGYRLSSIVFEKGQYKLYICFRHITSKFSISLSDSTKRKYPPQEDIDKIAKFAPKKLNSFSEGQVVVTNITNGIDFMGDSYKDQVNQVKKFLQDYLDTNKH